MTSINANNPNTQNTNNLTGYDPRLAGSVRFTATNQATGAGLVSNPANAFFSMLNQAIQQKKGQEAKTTVMGLKEKPAKEAAPETDVQTEETNPGHDVSRRQDPKSEKESPESEKVNSHDKPVKSKQDEKSSSEDDTSDETDVVADENVTLSEELMPRLPEHPCLGPPLEVKLDETMVCQLPVQMDNTDVLKGLPVQQALLVNELNATKESNAKDPSLNGIKSITGLTPLTHPGMKGNAKPLTEMPENAQTALTEKSNSPVFNPLATKLVSLTENTPQIQGLPLSDNQNHTNGINSAFGKPLEGLMPDSFSITEEQTADVSLDGLTQSLSALKEVSPDGKNMVAPLAKSIAMTEATGPADLNKTQSKTPDNLFINQLQVQGDFKAFNTDLTESDKLKIKAGEGILSKMSDITPQAVQVSVNLGQTQTNTGNFGNQPEFSDFEGFESDSSIGALEGSSGVPGGFNIQGQAEGLNALGQSAKVKVAGQTPTDQVVNATKMAVNNGQKEMTLQLTPDNLGQVRINLVSTANGQLHARFVASSQETQQELNAKVEQLRASLEKQGVNVGQITVIAAGETGAGNQNGNQNANQQAQNDLFRQPEGNVNPNQQGQGGQSQTQQQSNATGNPIPNSRQNNASTGQGSESQPSETNPPEQNMRDKNMRDGSRVSVLI
jgi:hypothetical protein